MALLIFLIFATIAYSLVLNSTGPTPDPVIQQVLCTLLQQTTTKFPSNWNCSINDNYCVWDGMNCEGESLYLRGPQIIGSIPPAFGQLTVLQNL